MYWSAWLDTDVAVRKVGKLKGRQAKTAF